MTGVVTSGQIKSFGSSTFGGAGSILVETRRNGTAEGWYNVLIMLRNERIPILLHATDELTGQHQFDYLSTSQTFTALAYDRLGISQGAIKTDITPSINPSATILDFAGQGAAGPNTATISLVLRDRDNAIRANLTGLHWVFFDQASPDDFIAVVDSGTGETTDGSGNFQVTVNNTTLNNGETGFIVISNTDGNSGNQSIAHAAPVEVVVS